MATLATDEATESNQVAGLATLAESQPSGHEKQLNRRRSVRNQSSNKAGNKVDCIGNKKKCKKSLAAQSQLKITNFMKHTTSN